MKAIRRLSDALTKDPGTPADGLQLRQGVITALSGGSTPTVTVRIGKATTAVPGIRYGSWYFPAVNDVVHLIQNGRDLLCVGTLASAVAALVTPTAAAAYVAKGDLTSVSVATTESTTSTSFTDLATVGPAVTVATGTRALVIVTADVASPGVAGAYAIMGYAISGATTRAATDARSLTVQAGGAVSQRVQASAVYVEAGLTAGNNTFLAKYRATAGTATFDARSLTVIPL